MVATVQHVSWTHANSDISNRERGIIQSPKITFNNCVVLCRHAILIQTQKLVLNNCTSNQLTRMPIAPFQNLPVRLQAGYVTYNNCEILRGEPIVIQAASVTFNNCEFVDKALKIQACRVQMILTNIRIVDDEQAANAAQIPALEANPAEPLVHIEEIEEAEGNEDVPATTDGRKE